MDQHGRILIVDDNATNVDILRRLLRKDYELAVAGNGEECLAIVPTFKPQLVLLDIMMPGMDGYEACRRIKFSAIGDFVQVILVSGKGSAAERIKGYEFQADDYIVKPFDHDELLSKVRVQFRLWNAQRQLTIAKEQLEIYNSELEELVAVRTQQLTATQDMAVFALAHVADSRDPETGEHLQRMRRYAQIIAEELADHGPYAATVDRRFLEDLYRSSPLHDIGKVAVPDAILQKPGPLTPEEFEEMKKHVIVGGQTLEMARDQVGPGSFMDMAAEIARYHHEKFDGTGYCAGLRGQEIPLSARIVALADVYDALTSRRVYKPPFTPEAAREIIIRDSGSHFDSVVVDAFLVRFDDFLDAETQAATTCVAQ
jgi:response regulator RpfG family c-di-GMP phosphodiesterase